jgi:serine/threonine-protein kinase
MTTGSGGKPPSASGERSSQPGRPAADTPNRLVVRSLDSGTGGDSMLGATDTAVAIDGNRSSASFSATQSGPTPSAGTPALSTELIGSTLSGKFLINRKVGQGGMGAVYEATHTQLGKRVAVKVLLEKYAQREAIVKRLRQEAQLASSVGNEHIIDITDIGTTEDGRTYVVMEFLEGESLAECLGREIKLSEQRILKVISQAASALAAAHAKGVVHRDIKPENLFLLKRKEQDFVKVVDFGISKSLRASGEEEVQRLTQTGMVLGTPLYMSPEQARGDDELDARVDIYALGVIMYECATGTVPFVGNNYLSVISQVLNETPKPIRELRPEISDEFEAVVGKAMEKNKTERYASANEMLADLSALLDDPTHSTERARITGPRRRLQKKLSSSRYIVWIGGVAVIIAAVAVTVKVMMGGSNAKPVVTPPDAQVAVAPPDAVAVAPPDAEVVPQEKLLEIEIVTNPPGATLIKDGLEVPGVTPMKIKVVKANKEVEIVAKLANYNDKLFRFNPLEIDPTKPQKVTLEKPKQGARPVQIVPKSGSAASSGSGHSSGGGDFGGFPGGGGGTVPKK